LSDELLELDFFLELLELLELLLELLDFFFDFELLEEDELLELDRDFRDRDRDLDRDRDRDFELEEEEEEEEEDELEDEEEEEEDRLFLLLLLLLLLLRSTLVSTTIPPPILNPPLPDLSRDSSSEPKPTGASTWTPPSRSTRPEPDLSLELLDLLTWTLYSLRSPLWLLLLVPLLLRLSPMLA